MLNIIYSYVVSRGRRLVDLVNKEQNGKEENEKNYLHVIAEKKCIQLITENRRKELNDYYWHIPWHEQKMFIIHNISRKYVKRRKKANQGNVYRKYETLQYSLKDSNDSKTIVCETFFLTTLERRFMNTC